MAPVTPMLATLADAPFDDKHWAFEIKWDGIRAIATIAGDRLRLVSRNGISQLAQFPELEDIPKAFRVDHLVVDGEIVTFDKKGRSSFQRLQPRLNRRKSDPRLAREAPAVYVVFDLLQLGDTDVRSRPLDVRQAVLRKVLKTTARVRLSRRVVGKGRALFARARRLGLEGIMAKRRDSTYQPRRSRDWLKIKTVKRQEVVIGGWTEPQGSRTQFGALLVGYYRDGKLQYAGRVGGGFTQATLREVMAKLVPLRTARSPFVDVPKSNEVMHWVRPRLVAEVKFGEWTTGGLMRQPIYLGLRTDKAARTVVREGR